MTPQDLKTTEVQASSTEVPRKYPVSSSRVPSKLGYGDPPYPGQAKRHYTDDPSGIPPAEVDSARLLQDLVMMFDGFALSTSEPGLLIIMDDLPKGYLRENKIRIAPWVKPWSHFRPFVNVQYTHEYVLFKTIRPNGARPSVKDHLVCNPTRQKGTHGAKPDAFCDWVLDLIGYQPGDDIIDMYPGSGAFTRAIERRT
jgi:hypothetical protein